MRQRLNSGYQFHAKGLRTGIQIFELFFRIPAPSIAEIRVLWQGIHILHIQLQGIVTHPAQNAHELFHCFRPGHRIAGAVQHSAQPLIGWRFLQPPAHGLPFVLFQKKRGAGKVPLLCQQELPPLFGAFQGNSRPSVGHLHLHCRFGDTQLV